MKVALDTTNILGRGAVKDTYNLLADGIVKLLRALAASEKTTDREWAKAQGYGRYLASSIKGEAAIDWSDKRARTALLAGIVADADRLLELARLALGELEEDSAERQQIVTPAELLGRLLLQDVERTDDGASLKDGVSRDRMMSVHDPEMRHGHKSSSRRFDGHKAAIVVDTDSQLITAVDVLPGNAPDNLGALELVEQSEANTGVSVEEAMGDAAYGDGDTRQAFADAGRTLIARVPGRPNRKHFPKEDFHIDLEHLIDAPHALPARLLQRRVRFEVEIGDDLAPDHPRAVGAGQYVRVLAEPADSRPLRRRPVVHRAVVDEHPRPHGPADSLLQTVDEPPEPALQHPVVVVAPGVARHPACRPGPRFPRLPRVVARRERYDRPGAGQQKPRMRGLVDALLRVLGQPVHEPLADTLRGRRLVSQERLGARCADDVEAQLTAVRLDRLFERLHCRLHRHGAFRVLAAGLRRALVVHTADPDALVDLAGGVFGAHRFEERDPRRPARGEYAGARIEQLRG